MFKNLLNLLIDFPGLINDKNILKDTKKRRKIGSDIVAMERITYQLKRNAVFVRDELERCINLLSEEENCYMDSLCFLLEKQALLVEEIEKIFGGEWTYNTIFRMYNYDFLMFHNIIDTKLSIVQMIRASISTNPAEIPMTFDLDDYADRFIEYSPTHRIPHYNIMKVYRKMFEGGMRFTSKDRKELLEHLKFLHNQVIEFDSVNKLEEARQKLAEIIRDNFSIEEIVCERETED